MAFARDVLSMNIHTVNRVRGLAGMPACTAPPPSRCRPSWVLRRTRPGTCAGLPAASVKELVSVAAEKATALDQEAEANVLGQQLREWVEDAGGYIHPALQLSMATPHGYRGVVAQEAIPLDATCQAPLIAVPERCLLSAEAAAQQLGPLLQRQPAARAWPRPRQQQAPWWAPWARRQRQQAQAGQSLLPPPELLLALLLAAERRRGAASAWAPYIAALPEDLPCGWALGPQQLAAELAALGSLAEGWAPQVQAAAAAVDRRAAAAADAWGEQLGGVTAADIRWALAHVISRCFGSGGDLALLPFIDLCNHRQGADRPQGFTSEAGEPCAAVYSRQQGRPQALEAGAEFCITYVAGTSPLQFFLNFGFVPHKHRTP